MKFKLITFLLFPFFLNAQNVTFESVFSVVEQKDTIEIYHVKTQVCVKSTNIEIFSIEGDTKKLVFNFPVSMQTFDNNVYWCSDENGSTVTFIKDVERLFITNSTVKWTIYGKIPNLLKFNK